MITNLNGLTIAEIGHDCPSTIAEGPVDGASDQYCFVSTPSIIEIMYKELGFVPTHAMQARTLDKANGPAHAKHIIRFRHQDDLGSTKPETLEAVLINGHNLYTPYEMKQGVYRFICSNGLFVGETYRSLKVNHRGDILGQIVEGTLTIVEEGENTMNEIEEMKQIELTRPEQLLLAEQSMHARFGDEEIPYRPEDFLRHNRYDDGSNNLWSKFNTLQQNLVTVPQKISRYDGKARKNRSVRPVNQISRSIELNQMLWALAAGMKELKQNG